MSLLLGAQLGCSSDEGSSGSGGAAGSPAGGAAGAALAGAPAGGAAAGAAPTGGVAGVAGAAVGGAAPTGGGAGAGGATGGSGGGAVVGLPASDGKDDLLAFLKAGTYRSAPWIPESPEPRAPQSSPHGTVQVWMNAPLVDSWRNGRDGEEGRPRADAQSMAIKELYDAAGARVGYAVIYRSGAADEPNSWVFYCYGPGRCDSSGTVATEAAPIYGRGTTGNSCHFCHSMIPGLQPFITPAPPP